MGNNIVYKTKQIKDFYRGHRRRWEEFYPSERWVFEKIFSASPLGRNILDVGCACGGLGLALCEKFHLISYTGVDINQEAIVWAGKSRAFRIPATFITGDIVNLKLKNTYDMVTSLGCADWNLQTQKIISACWDKVKKGGYFVVSLRLTQGAGINDITRSYQYINFNSKEKDPEIANYVVLNFDKATSLFISLKPKPELIGAYGYYGKPSATAVTPFKKVVFSVFYIKKSISKKPVETTAEFRLPMELLQRGVKGKQR